MDNKFIKPKKKDKKNYSPGNNFTELGILRIGFMGFCGTDLKGNWIPSWIRILILMRVYTEHQLIPPS